MKALISAIILLSQLAVSAQQSKEFGVFLGGSNYHGDLADEIVLAETHASFGLFYRHNFNEYWTYRPMLSYLRISGSDQNFEANRMRNLNFRSDIIELSNTIELNYQDFSNSPFHNQWTSFAFIGISLYYHNPKTELNGEYYELHPLNTENVPLKKQYKRFQVSVPFGGGIKYAFTPNFIGTVELGWRKTFTDYLDDVSTVYPEESANMQLTDRSWEIRESNTFVAEPGDQRGDPRFKDWYLQGGITLAYRFTPILCWATK